MATRGHRHRNPFHWMELLVAIDHFGRLRRLFRACLIHRGGYNFRVMLALFGSGGSNGGGQVASPIEAKYRS